MNALAVYVAVVMPPIWVFVGREILRAWREDVAK
jgi:hypothetical protein